ncbi:MAG: D-alanyl-D-alanine carboxypeptidase/D-alanyl-D-alanine-endopeptidase [Succinivibrio sp.]|nr:D-alanyl-D-alanine carboxypeptidase/D-alanyl-D-alanine-endopeptidase [Succinivibrio sp.]
MMYKKSAQALLFSAGLCLCASAAHAVSASSTPVAGANLGIAYLTPHSQQVQGFNIDTYFHPASTQKLLTALAALLFLGPDYQMLTTLAVRPKLVADGQLKLLQGGRLPGDLYVNFAGDPTFTVQKFKNLVHELKKAGVNQIDGTVYVNVSRFAGKSRGQGWSWDDLPVCFTAPASAVVINRNCVFAQLQPHGAGQLATPLVSDGNPITLESRAIGVKASEYGGDCELEANLFMDNHYQIAGCVPIQPKNKPWPLSLSVSDPDKWGLDWTRLVLKSQQISYGGLALTHQLQSDLIDIYAHASPNLRELCRYMLQKSNNLYADSIAKNLAFEYFKRPATYDRVSTAIRRVLKKKAQIELGNAYIVDGSGLSPHNLLTPRELLGVLDYINQHDAELNFIELLPVADQSGTMRWRGSVREAPLAKNVTAKTGSLTNVSNLAGFVTTQSGVRVPFVIFANMLTHPEQIREQLKYHRIAKPSLKYERYVLEQIYAEQGLTRPN